LIAETVAHLLVTVMKDMTRIEERKQWAAHILSFEKKNQTAKLFDWLFDS